MAQTEKFCIAREGKTASIIVDADDWKGVIRAARDLGDDVRKVTGVASQVDLQTPNSAGLHLTSARTYRLPYLSAP